MAQPKGKLTGTQLEIMECIWSAPADGIKATDIWQTLCERRGVARTTVLTMVQRLEKRGWLKRSEPDRVVHYTAVLTKDAASASLAAGFLDEFFAGSPTQLVRSLLGSRKIKKAELKRLRDLLGDADAKGGSE